MKVKIITDSACDMSLEEAREKNVSIAPMRVSFGDEEFTDRFEISCDEFYSRLSASSTLPTTTQATVSVFEELFASCNEQEIVVVLISAELSGTLQSATIASQSFPEKNIYIVDSTSATIGERVMVDRAVQLRDMGLSGKQIASTLEIEKKRLRLLAVIDTLKYLHKGGRLSAAKALAGGLLGIKPVITIENGKIELIGKERGTARAMKFLYSTAQGMGLPDPVLPCSIGFSGTDTEAIEPLKAVFDPSELPSDFSVTHIGSTVGTHVGPGAVGIAYFAKE